MLDLSSISTLPYIFLSPIFIRASLPFRLSISSSSDKNANSPIDKNGSA